MQSRLFLTILFCGFLSSAYCQQPAAPQGGTDEWPGPRADGSVLLPNLWSLRPAGKQVLLGDFPVNVAVHPSGKWAAALHSGYGQNEITVVQLPQGEVISRAPINESFYGLVFNSRGTELFCSGAGDEVVHRFQFRNGYLSDHQEVTLRRAASRGIPSGIALDPDGERLYCANVWGQSIDIVSLRSGLVKSIVLSTNIPTPAGLAPAKNEDEAAITKRAEAALQEANSEDPFPYGCALDAERSRLYASFWAQATVGVFDAQTGLALAHWPTEEHPNELILSRKGKHLFVAG